MDDEEWLVVGLLGLRTWTFCISPARNTSLIYSNIVTDSGQKASTPVPPPLLVCQLAYFGDIVYVEL